MNGSNCPTRSLRSNVNSSLRQNSSRSRRPMHRTDCMRSRARVSPRPPRAPPTRKRAAHLQPSCSSVPRSKAECMHSRHWSANGSVLHRLRQSCSKNASVSALVRSLDRLPTSSRPTVMPQSLSSAISARRCTPSSCATPTQQPRFANGTQRRSPVHCCCCRSMSLPNWASTPTHWPRACRQPALACRGCERFWARCARSMQGKPLSTNAAQCSCPAPQAVQVRCNVAPS